MPRRILSVIRKAEEPDPPISRVTTAPLTAILAKADERARAIPLSSAA